jgi:hypothetical protein
VSMVKKGIKMKSNYKVFYRFFGDNDYGFADIPPKFSNTQISRYSIASTDSGVCTYCFPHGPETPNGAARKPYRSWKEYRKSQFKKV